ncbi:hypothetical protein FKM82_001060 [Ascaphus truei]
MPNYKLTYFNIRGRGELIRYLFAYMDTAYEDHRITFSDWPAIKSSIPYGKLPILEIDGEVFHQSLAIGRYLAREAGLAGKSNLDQARIDGILDSIDDFLLVFPWRDADETKQKQRQEEYLANFAPELLSNLEKCLGDKLWFVGNSVTLADLFWDICSDTLEVYKPGFAQNYPKLLSVKDKVKSIPAIAAWIKKRPQTRE